MSGIQTGTARSVKCSHTDALTNCEIAVYTFKSFVFLSAVCTT